MGKHRLRRLWACIWVLTLPSRKEAPALKDMRQRKFWKWGCKSSMPAFRSEFAAALRMSSRGARRAISFSRGGVNDAIAEI